MAVEKLELNSSSEGRIADPTVSPMVASRHCVETSVMLLLVMITNTKELPGEACTVLELSDTAIRRHRGYGMTVEVIVPSLVLASYEQA